MAWTDKPNDARPPHTPLCALGASAGGITALKKFFKCVKNDLGLAYVVIVHLAPDQPSSLSEIIATQTSMPVSQINHGAKLKPDCVYVIPPNRELVIDGDDITARPFSGAKGRRSPIDMFFQSVAEGRGDGIAVLLSGSGSDGTLGVRAVKEAGGVIFAQEPGEAEFPMMPESAIATGVVDFVVPIATLTERLAEVVRSKKKIFQGNEEDAEQQVRQIVAFLRRRVGHDFSDYKRPTIMRRLARRMQVVRQESFADYYRYLQSNKNEVHELFSDLLISVTSFFRDPEAFAALAEKVVKPLFDKLDDEASIRVWVIGCATGEEAYSIGILLLEEAARRGAYPIMQIFASDIDDMALATAREGRYPKSIEADVSDERLRRFFVMEDAHYRVRKELRDLVLFASHSALKDPPFIKIDLITCRNLLIYLQRELQRQLCGLFHYALRANGYVFLGSAETIDINQSQFSAIDRDARIYVSLGQAEKVAPILPQLTSDFRAVEHRVAQPTQLEPVLSVGHAHVAALERSAPPSVLVDGSFKILHLSPNVGRFFRPLEGPFSTELPAQVRPELRVDLKLALQRAFEKGETSLSVPIPVAFNGDAHLVALHVTPCAAVDQSVAGQALVLFMDLGKAPGADEISDVEGVNSGELKRLRQELTAAQDRLSAGRREYEQATQDSRAANEELQSINEEYRSTAEELETSKEELQSINEELQTVNGELKNKLEAISTAHNDLQNLVAATEIGTLFLDPNLKIRFFTPRIHDYFNISKTDIGRVISDFRHRLVYDGLEQDVAGVLKNLIPVDRDIKTSDGRWLSMQVRPYRTLEEQIDGVVVTFTDITKLKLAEQGLAAELRAMARLQELSTKVMEADQFERPMGTILDAIVELIGADMGSIQLYDEASQTLRLLVHRGFQKRFLDHFATVDASSASASGAALLKGERLAFEDVEKEPALAVNLKEIRDAGYRAVVSAPLYATSGRMVGMLSLYFREPHQFSPHELRLVDICARQAADAISVYLLQQALREADRRKDEFLAMLAHELRNPLTPIHNALHVLKRSALPAPEVERLHDLIERQASHLVRLVDDLLDVARITRGKIELRCFPIDLKDAVRQAIETTMPLFEAKGQHIDVSMPEEPLVVDGDVVRLSQVFSNLLNNASKFTPAEGHVALSMDLVGDNVVVRVRDDGAGFSPQALAHAFELFNQGDKPSGLGRSGIGVGLALARGIVELHGGKIKIFSQGAGKGSEIEVTLAHSKAKAAVSAQLPSSPAKMPTVRVLVVEDQRDVAETLALLIQSLGGETCTTEDGASALAAIEEFKPNLVITDIGLPGMDGYELASQIRKLVKGQKVVLAALSGWGQEEVRQRALKAGFDFYFVKPIEIDALTRLLSATGKMQP
ncbi:CheR family methyltransferase [Methylocystis parvus]|uniref:Response regulator n=1 Tax=Methylocystis parvus TaxID=134 RepID=A0A6B8M8F6_9HYPH|nr:CheR family methyltransferase [Methylocystis parvus]QGM98866.1 response regulator [Methylocystis parvus]WBK00781.1 PAS domain-containing protein [Methylocystis parvus OBBP]